MFSGKEEKEIICFQERKEKIDVFSGKQGKENDSNLYFLRKEGKENDSS